MAKKRRTIFVDGKGFYSREEAIKEYAAACAGTDGSERERMAFALACLYEGSKHINTYKEIAD